MARPAAEILSSEIQQMLIVDPEEEEKARLKIVEAMLQLHHEGQIKIPNRPAG